MLSEEEKKEMLEDARNQKRRTNFREGKKYASGPIPFDTYISFLDNFQKIFGPFKVSRKTTITKFNKL